MSLRHDRIGIVTFNGDIASTNIFSLLSIENTDSILETDTDLIYAKFDLQTLEKFDALIFLSRHKAEKGIPSLTVHSVGNFGKAEFGGQFEQLGLTNSLLVFCLINELYHQGKKLVPDFHITLEATHHGPLCPIPSVFIEVGSTPEDWRNIKACQAVANTVSNVLKSRCIQNTDERFVSAIGIGGGHYSEKFTKILLDPEEMILIGHICPKYHNVRLDSVRLEEMIEKTFPRPNTAILDKKGVKQKGRIKELLKEKELEIIQF